MTDRLAPLRDLELSRSYAVESTDQNDDQYRDVRAWVELRADDLHAYVHVRLDVERSAGGGVTLIGDSPCTAAFRNHGENKTTERVRATHDAPNTTDPDALERWAVDWLAEHAIDRVRDTVGVWPSAVDGAHWERPIAERDKRAVRAGVRG